MIQVHAVAYRFGAPMVEAYVSAIKLAMAGGRQVYLVGNQEVQAKFQRALPMFLTADEMAAIKTADYPRSETEANNLGRGSANTTFIIVDNDGRYTDIIASAAEATNDPDVFFVHH